MASVRDASAEGERGPLSGNAAPLDLTATDRAPVVWKRTWVDERPAMYGVAGDGLPVVILHGWGLAHHAYKGAIQRLVALGCRVYAPAQPGFGGTAELPKREFSLAGYARWVERFLDAVHVDEPVFLIGHSFGGGVAIRFAHDYPGRVRSLVLVNSIGGSAWKAGSKLKALADRPLWDWGLHFPSDIWPIPQATKVLPIMLEDALPNLLRNPLAMLKVGSLALPRRPHLRARNAEGAQAPGRRALGDARWDHPEGGLRGAVCCGRC